MPDKFDIDTFISELERLIEAKPKLRNEALLVCLDLARIIREMKQKEREGALP